MHMRQTRCDCVTLRLHSALDADAAQAAATALDNRKRDHYGRAFFMLLLRCRWCLLQPLAANPTTHEARWPASEPQKDPLLCPQEIISNE